MDRIATLALLLDLDGTLFDSFDAILAAMNAALAEFKEPPLRAQELRPLIGIPVARQMEMLRGMAGPRVDEIGERYYRHFAEHVERGLPLYPRVRETLQALSSRPLGTMTTRRRDTARRMLEVGGIAQYFRAITGGDEAARPKPEPDLPRIAAKALGRVPRECAVVGDAPVDVLAGRAAGSWTIAATYGYGELAALREARPHATIAAFSELPKAIERLESSRKGPATP